MYRALDPAAILKTSQALSNRIAERFPGSGLSRVSLELAALAQESAHRIGRLQRPLWPIRLAVLLGFLVILGIISGLLFSMPLRTHSVGLAEFLQGLEAAVNDVIFLGVAIFFLFNVEGRVKRRTALRALHELRSIAHVIDMHQLTKDPEQLLSPAMATASSPHREMTRFGLARYLDYCSEMLSITSKVAALYVQYLDDALVLNSVNSIQSLATGLSAKIWQKIVILDTLTLHPALPDARDPPHRSSEDAV
jgi:hypothetical protein